MTNRLNILGPYLLSLLASSSRLKPRLRTFISRDNIYFMPFRLIFKISFEAKYHVKITNDLTSDNVIDNVTTEG